MEPIAISVATMCKQLSIGRTKAAEMIKNQEVVSILIGRRRLVLTSSISALLAKSATAQHGNAS